jgi:hypothetical protein
MATYIIYAADGSVLQVGGVDDTIFDTMLPYLTAGFPSGASVMRIAELPLPIDQLTARTYVDNNVLRQRVPIPAVVSTSTIVANGVATAEITALPIPCTATITGAVSVAPFVLSDGILDITSNAVGQIVVSVTAAPPYLAWSTIILAT